MGFLSDLGNIFHAIGGFFEGGDNNNAPQQNNHISVAPPNQPGRVFIPTPYNGGGNNQNPPNNQNNQNNQNNNQQPKTQPDPFINLYQGPQKAQPKAAPTPAPAPPRIAAPHPVAAPAPNPQQITAPNLLAKANPNNVPLGTPENPNDPNLPFMQHVRDVQAEANQAPATTADRAINTVGDSLARTIIGIPQGISHLWDLVTPGKGTNRFSKSMDTTAKEIDQNQQTQGLQGRAGNDLYHGLQIAENVIPAAAGVITKVPSIVSGGVDLVKAIPGAVSKIPGAVAKIPDLIQAPEGVSDALPALNKVGTATDTKAIAGTQAPDEIAVGLKSANPNQGADALKAIQEKEAQAAAAQPQAVPTSGPGAQAAGEIPPAPAEAVQPAANPQPAQTALPLDENAPAATVQPAQTPPETTTPTVNPQSASSAPSSPELVNQMKNDLKTAGSKAGDINNPTHDVLSNEDLNTAAQRYVQTQSDEDLLKSYSTGANIKDAESMATANAALGRLGELSKAGNAQADQAIENILEGAAQGTSKGARLMNYVQSMYDSLPQPAKVKYLVRAINKARDTAGLAPLSDEEAANAETTIDHFLTETQQYNDAAAKAEGEIEAIKAKIGTGALTKDDLNKIAEYDKMARDNQLAAGKTQGDLARAYDQFAPQARNVTNIGNSLGNLGRSLMLTSVSGRLSDVATTSINTFHALLQNAVEGGLGKVLNAARSVAGKEPGKYIDTMPSPKAFVQGTDQGLKKAAGNYKGNTYVDDIAKAVKDTSRSEGGKTQLARAGSTGLLNKVRNVSHAMAETATNISQGVKNTKILQMAYQDGKQQGLEGLDLDVYAHSTAALPTRAMEAKGQQLLEEVNNMNDNHFTSWLEGIAKGLDKVPIVGEQVRNLIAPFNRWVGGQMWNGLTDKNAVANIIKGGQAMLRGDSQEVVHQLAGLTTNTVGTMGAGYALANSGVLTTKNGAGYNDDGLYLHLGGHFIPIGFFGFAAPGLIMGWATHQAMTNKNGGSMLAKIMHAAGTSFATLSHAYFGNTVIGGGSELLNQIQEALQSKDNITGGDVAATAATDAVGNYVPGAAGDANAAINTFNIGNLNPTHEAALTKVTKGQEGVLTKTGSISTQKDIPRSDVNTLINKVPVLGQKVLPRNPGVPANDFASRITRGDNQSAQEVAAQQQAANPQGPAKAKAQLAADKQAFIKSQKEIGTVNGKTYINYKGKVSSFDDPMRAQQALDYSKFKDGNQDFQQINGMVYQRGSDGKTSAMEQKDYDYKTASDQITSSKNSGDVTGYVGGVQGLLNNISWQLQHADLTQANRDALIQKAVQTQEDYAKTAQYGGFTKPKGVPTYSSPQITGAKQGYVKAIQEAGAKYGVDINALLSVAAQEGLGGGVGDNGTSFGPFQMHEGGALPPGKDQAWAESPEGIDYAVQQIAKVAGGKTGAEAIQAIVNGFEKSADPQTEINNALALYSGGSATLSPGGTGVASLTPSSSSSTAAANLVKSNKIGSLPSMARESFVSNLSAKPINVNIPQVKVTPPGGLIKARKISVGMPRA